MKVRVIHRQDALTNLLVCPDMVRILLQFDVSQICTRPVFVPTARCVPLCVHATEDTTSPPRSHSFVTCSHKTYRASILGHSS